MWEETRHLKGGKILRSSSSTDQIDKLKEICGHLLRNYDWSNAEINDEGLPCCPACHEPLIGIWHDDAIFHEFPRLGEVFLADIGKPYLQACACQRALSAPSYAETLAMEEKRRHLLKEAGLPIIVASTNFDTLDYGLNSNWKDLAPLLRNLVFEWTREARQGIMLVGPSGAGKTMMMAALVSDFVRKHLVPVRYYTERALLDGMRNRRTQTVDTIKSADVILVDDLGTTQYRSGDRSLATQGDLWDAISEIDGSGATLIVASSFTPDGLVYDCGIRADTILKLKRLCPQGFRVLPVAKHVTEVPCSREQ